ncbi:LCP family protein [Quadrisphaera sp. KR29]|uniref:LCP family protein n=1 Tax=Quadrisphaera sp. KR29 TaxID=3461391 RepID=UPI0040443661
MTVTEPGSYPRRRDVRDSRDVRGARGAGPARGATATAARPPAPRRPPEGPPSRPASEVTLIHAGDDPRGRHASSTGEGFTRLVLLTVLGAALPGAGLVAAGRRWGWLVLLPVLAALGALGAVVATGRLVPLARSVVFNPTAMLVLAAGAVVGALLWCLVVVASHAGLRRSPAVGRLSRGQRLASLVLVTALLALVVAPSATAARYAMANHDLLEGVFGSESRDGDGPDTGAADPWAQVPRVNVLMLGADTGADRVGTRPDTIMLASIDTRTGGTTLLNLPRQLEDVPFPEGSAAAKAWPKACKEDGEGGCMLNAVYLFGTLHPEMFGGTEDGNDPGVEATKEAVSTATGLDVDYYAMVDLEGFQQLVDAMGGLTLNVPRDIPIGGGHNLETGGTYPVTGWIKKGQAQQLDGYQALWFARSREGSDNNDRMARQQCVVSAAVQQYDALALAQAFPAIAEAAEKNIQTDIPADELNAFVTLGQTVKGGDLRALSVTSANISTGDPDYDALRAMVQEALYPPPPAPAAPADASAPASGAPAPAPAEVDPHQAVDPTTTC